MKIIGEIKYISAERKQKTGEVILYGAETRHYVGTVQERESAAIITACNAYPSLQALNAELVEALESERQWLEQVLDYGTDSVYHKQGGFARRLDLIDAVLAKAKEAK